MGVQRAQSAEGGSARAEGRRWECREPGAQRHWSAESPECRKTEVQEGLKGECRGSGAQRSGSGKNLKGREPGA